jgi:hypothetical protein
MTTGRSSLECRLYIELHPCDCGGSVIDITDRVVMHDDTLCARYSGSCSACGQSREYLFALDPEIPAPDAFGGANPSTIIDAGQYLAASERAAKQVQLGGSPADSVAARSLLARAIACLEEVMKWIPDGDERVPMSAFFTSEGQRVHASEPGRFRRIRLLAVLATYRELLLRMG